MSTHTQQQTGDPERIYLGPEDCADPELGRTWCEDDWVWVDADGRDASGTEYVRADLAAAERERLEAENAWLREQVTRLSRASEEGCACDATGPCYYHAELAALTRAGEGRVGDA
jgi:hypothetical protein